LIIFISSFILGTVLGSQRVGVVGISSTIVAGCSISSVAGSMFQVSGCNLVSSVDVVGSDIFSTTTSSDLISGIGCATTSGFISSTVFSTTISVFRPACPVDRFQVLGCISVVVDVIVFSTSGT